MPNRRREALLSNWFDLNAVDIGDLLRRSLADGYLDFVDQHALVSAGRRELDLHGGGIEWAGRNGFLITIQEVTAPDPAVTALRDSPTGLPNRAFFATG